MRTVHLTRLEKEQANIVSQLAYCLENSEIAHHRINKHWNRKITNCSKNELLSLEQFVREYIKYVINEDIDSLFEYTSDSFYLKTAISKMLNMIQAELIALTTAENRPVLTLTQKFERRLNHMPLQTLNLFADQLTANIKTRITEGGKS